MVSAIFSNCNPSCLIWALQFCHMVIDGTYHCCVRSRKVSCSYSCGSSAERARKALGFGAEVCHSDSALQWLNQHHSKDFLLSLATFSLNESSEQQRSFSPGPLCSFCSFLFPYLQKSICRQRPLKTLPMNLNPSCFRFLLKFCFFNENDRSISKYPVTFIEHKKRQAVHTAEIKNYFA